MARRLCVFLVLLFVSNHAFSDENGKKWFAYGTFESGIAYPHNEIGVNLRRPDLPETNGFGDNYGRYALRGELIIGRRLNTPIVKGFFMLARPYFIFGRTIPQMEYTWSARFIGHLNNYGVGVALWRDWKVYFELHEWNFRDKAAVTGDGPFEMYNMIVIRKEFKIDF